MMKATRKLITTLMAVSVLGGTVTGVALVGGGTALAAGHGGAVTSRIASAPHDRTVGLTQLINNGTITRAQANAIETAMIARMRAEGSSTSLTRMGLSREQGLRFMSAVLSQLVTNGTISQAQAEAVTDSVTLRGMMDYGQGSGSVTRGYGMMGNGNGNGPASDGSGMMGGF
jgi:competence protein ComGC